MKTLLNHLYKMAAAENVVRSNIAQYITLPTLDETVGSPFSAEDQKKLWLLYEAGDAFCTVHPTDDLYWYDARGAAGRPEGYD